MPERLYRGAMGANDLCSFRVCHKESDLWCAVSKEAFEPGLQRLAHESLAEIRAALEGYIAVHPEFETSLEPLETLPGAPTEAVKMASAGRLAGVGPFAAVAGAIADGIGKVLREHSPDVIVENGGDIFLLSKKRRTIGLYAGESGLSGRVGLEVDAPQGMGICSSSGTVGHSLSFGKADCVAVLAPTACIADAYATGLANLVRGGDDVNSALDVASRCEGIGGVVIIVGKRIGVWGEVTLRPIQCDLTGQP